MALQPGQAARLARALRDLRESEWPDLAVTQAQLAKAFSTESRVASATLSSWESATNPKTPTTSRLNAYARFFATRRSLDGEPHLITEEDLDEGERERFRELEDRLLDLLNADQRADRTMFAFEDGPVTIVCSAAPTGERGPMAAVSNANFTKLEQYADKDALIEIWGHTRASNPTLDEISFCLPDEVKADNLSSHVILLGGIGWNHVTRRFQGTTGQMPITQVEVDTVKTGEIFRVKDEDGEKSFFPTWEDVGGAEELVEDVALLARLANPFKVSRTLTICNGIHSRGVLGAVRCLTDRSVRKSNEDYLAQRFPNGRFAVLLRVSVLRDETVSPDLQNPDVRLYEWSPKDGVR